jgi:hypothetical protein
MLGAVVQAAFSEEDRILGEAGQIKPNLNPNLNPYLNPG